MPEEKENIVADVQVGGTRNGTPTRTSARVQCSEAAAKSGAPSSPGVVTAACEGTGEVIIQGSELDMTTSSRLSSETSTPTSPLPQPSLPSHDSLRSVSQDSNRGDGSDVLCLGDVDHVLTKVDPLASEVMDDSANNLSDVAKKILGSGYPSAGGMVGVVTDIDRTVTRGGGGGAHTKLPALRRLPYVKRVKRTSSSDSTRATISEVSDIVDEFDKLCEAIDGDGRVKEGPARPPSEHTPPIREGHCMLRNSTSPPLLQDGDCHSNGSGLNGTPFQMQGNGLSRTGSYVNGHGDAVVHVTNGSGHVTNGSGHVTNGSGHVTNGRGHLTNYGHVTNGSGHVTNGYGHMTDGHSTSPSSPAGPHGVGSTDDSRIHIMDLEEEENELLKRALEESTKSQVTMSLLCDSFC